LSSETPLVLGGEFPPPRAEEWRQGVDRVLAKGKSDLSEEELAKRFARELTTQLYDGIEISPLYTSADVDPSSMPNEMPGFAPYIRSGSLLGGVQGGWDVRQPVDLDPADPKAANAVVLEHLERGATSVYLRAPLGPSQSEVTIDAKVLEATLDGVYLDLVSVSVDGSLGTEAAASVLDLFDGRGTSSPAAGGVLGLDPIGAYASVGADPGLQERLESSAVLAAKCVAHYPHTRAFVVDATRYHEAGSSDSEELACAIATGVAYLRVMTESGLSVDAAFGQIEFRFAATADQFLTVAKLRAARQLWYRVAASCGAASAGAQRQHAVTSRAMLSRYDPWVNLLRGTIACFSAGIGGADAVTVEPYDLFLEPGLVSDLGRRMARNSQLLLIEESHVAKVIDPAGGSWYVESLTQSVAEESWLFFQSIEALGGMAAALDQGLVHERIEGTWERRLSNLARRKDTVTGVSDFPNAGESIPLADPVPGVTTGLPKRRYAEPFEELRQRIDAYARTNGARPSIVLINVGSASDYTARTTYARSFFETAGLHVDALEVDVDFDAQVQARTAQGMRVACLCSSDPKYLEAGVDVVKRLAANGIERIYVAGRLSDELSVLQDAGVYDFVGVGSNVLASLQGVLEVLGVE
jgi:methylmalonyl-CoA mutase